ncbi:MAG: FG-GAP repeat protein [Planctomycetota bacterium]|jgi:hypothetical protein
MFRLVDDAWIEEDKLVGAGASFGDGIGVSVALHGEVAVAGAPGFDITGNRDGTAWVFRRDPVFGWQQDAQLIALAPASDDRFGADVAIWGDRIAAGSPRHDIESGRVDTFRHNGAVWIHSGEIEPILPPDSFFGLADEGDWLGHELAMNDDIAVSGANILPPGRVDLFDLAVSCGCPEDLSGNFVVNFGDVMWLIGTWGPCAGCPEDLNRDGDANFADLLRVIAAWGPCP